MDLFYGAIIGIVGILVGHWLAVRQISTRIFLEKRMDAVVMFVSSAYKNLQYIDPQAKADDPISLPTFEVEGSRAAFFMDKTISEQIEDYTLAYRGAWMKTHDPGTKSNWLKELGNLRQQLTGLKEKLKEAVRKPERYRIHRQ